MRIFTAIFCLFLSVSALGQGKKVSKKTNTPLIVIDGVIRDRAELSTLNPNEIYTIAVLKPAGAIPLYGSKGAHGAVMITTKTYKNAHTIRFSAVEQALASATAKPLLVIDGAIFKGDISSIDSNSVAGIEFIQGSSATMIYGAAGANGAINLKMKPHTQIDTLKTGK